jgi:aconitate hydratase
MQNSRPLTLAEKLIADHLREGTLERGSPIAIAIDQTLTQDATGTLVMLELEAMGVERVRTDLSVQYVDHNLVQADHKNADDHLFLLSACRRFGLWYSGPGNGVSHPVHMQRFGKPGKSLLGADSHTPAAGSLGMLAIGAGGLDVALAMTGRPFRLRMPSIWGIRLVGKLPEWVSAKDVILELLRRHDVDGGLGRILEYHGPGLAELSAMDRHVIANMGAELGATTTVFPSDPVTRRFLAAEGREADWRPLAADDGARYDVEDEIDLGRLEPLVACPTSPGNVVPVREVAGREIYQAYVGSSANPGYRDFAVVAEIVRGRRTHPRVSFDVNPTSRDLLETLARDGLLAPLIHAGARLHQAGCNGCIGMGQAPATGRPSLRTTPRNFPGRSGTAEDSVYLCSPETAAASALTGSITDPRELGIPYPTIRAPEHPVVNEGVLVAPLPLDEARRVELERGPNIVALPDMDPLPDSLAVPVLLVCGDDVSTDEILPAGARVLPFRSNVPAIAAFAFGAIDPSYPDRARQVRDGGGHAVVGGDNYGQGSSREHAALAPRFLGLRLVLVRSFARIHRQNLVNFGILPLTFAEAGDAEGLEVGDVLEIADVADALAAGPEVTIGVSGGREIRARHDLTDEEIDVLRAGGTIPWMRARAGARSAP